jgi:nucleolysin TIA-1/TIAR
MHQPQQSDVSSPLVGGMSTPNTIMNATANGAAQSGVTSSATGSSSHPAGTGNLGITPPIITTTTNGLSHQNGNEYQNGSGAGVGQQQQQLPQRKPYLYVGALSSQVNDVALKEIFSSVGPVLSTKVVVDRNMQHPGSLNYGFVEYADLRSAEAAIQNLNGRKIADSDIKVDWAASSLNHGDGGGGIHGISGNVAFTGGSGIGIMGKENTSHHFHVFVGDLAPEVNDSMLRQAFQPFNSLSEARVMWDISSGKSRGYGFVAFRERPDAEQAIATMNGEWLGSRAIRVNWANQKGTGNNGQHLGGHQGGMVFGNPSGPNRSTAVAATLGGMGALGLGATSMPPTGGAASGTPITYEQALAGSPQHNTTVYVGNIPPFANQNDLIPMFSQFGYIIEIRMQSDRGFAFVKLDTHENAASAIVNLAGHIACGRPIKCGWGKDRNESAMLNALRQGMQLSGYGNLAPPAGMSYGMPQYGFPGGFAYGSPGNSAQGGAPPMDAASIQQLQAAQAQAVQAAHAQAMQQQQQQQSQSQQQIHPSQHHQAIGHPQAIQQMPMHQNLQGYPSQP